MNSKIVKYLLIVGIIIIGVWISTYYWANASINSIKFVPVHIMVITLIYILMQIGKRYIFKKQNWWDWLYYIGLGGMMIGVFFSSIEKVNLYNSITDYSIVFLVIPGIIDFFVQTKNKETT